MIRDDIGRGGEEEPQGDAFSNNMCTSDLVHFSKKQIYIQFFS